jgi:hypothetical protein
VSGAAAADWDRMAALVVAETTRLWNRPYPLGGSSRATERMRDAEEELIHLYNAAHGPLE